MQITTVGLDLAKNVFQVHAIAHDGSPAVRRQLRRAEVLKFFAKLKQRCLVGMEACASAHYWGREIGALGHEVRLMPPAYMKPYVKRGKAMSTKRACASDVNRVSLRHSSRKRPLKPSTKPFCIGFPGVI